MKEANCRIKSAGVRGSESEAELCQAVPLQTRDEGPRDRLYWRPKDLKTQ